MKKLLACSLLLLLCSQSYSIDIKQVNPVGMGIYFSSLEPIHLTPPAFTCDSWSAIPLETIEINAWNSLYTGGGFVHSTLPTTRLTYTGDQPTYFVVRARLGGAASDNLDIVELGVSVNGSTPLDEQIIHGQDVEGSGTGSQPISPSGEIILKLNPGDYIEPQIRPYMNYVGTANIYINFFYMTVSEWNPSH